MKLRKIALTTAAALLVLAGSVTLLPLRAIAGLETPCNFISDLVATNPLSSDLSSTGDDHMRCIKLALKTTFPNVNGAVSSTDEELNIVDGVTSSAAELNILDGVTSSAAELNLLDGITGTVWSSGNDGSGSLLDADLLDNLNSAELGRLASPNTFTASGGASPAIRLSSASPVLMLEATGAASNEKIYWFNSAAGQLLGVARDDANSSGATWLTVDRTGTTIDSINLQATTVTATGVLTSTGQIQSPSGSAGTPSHSFSTDTDTGMYRAGANELGFATNGAAALEMDTNAADFTGSAISLSATGTRVLIITGAGSPEGVQIANVGSIYLRNDSSTTLYVKQSGSGNTGWVAK